MRREERSEEGLRAAHRADWVGAVLVCAAAVALIYTAPIAVLVPLLLVRRHRRERAAAATVRRAREHARLGPLDPAREAEQAEVLGLTQSARAWRAAAAAS